MALPHLQLSLQFARDLSDATRHRAALPRHAVQRWLRHAMAADGEITVRIVDTDEARALNRDYRGKDYATDVLTFDYAQAPLVMADLVLCGPVVARDARELGKTWRAHYAHLLVHGCLHAQGWDHETSAADEQAMQARENAVLQGLGFARPWKTAR